MQSNTISTSKSFLYTLLNEPLTFFGGFLLFLMVFSPTYNVLLKIILIAIVLIVIVLARIMFFKINITKEVFLWYFIFILHGIFFTALGLINANNRYFILRTTTYNIIWPILYLIFTIGVYKKTGLDFLIKIIILANFLVALYLIGSALTLLHVTPDVGLFGMSELAYDPDGGIFKIEIPAIISMMFTVPFTVSLTMLTGKKSFGFKKWFLYLSILVSVIGAISCARRALLLNILLGIFFTIFFSLWAVKPARRIMRKNLLKMIVGGAIFLTIIFIAVEQAGFLSVSTVLAKFSIAFAGQQHTDESVSIRYGQFTLLEKSWLQKPLLGHGHGAVSDFIIRSHKTPWIYELTYAALLFQTGAIGLLIYLALLLWPMYKGLQLVRKGNEETALLVIPLIVGCTCFLIANGTNPYLQSYDNMWALFLPIAVINYLIKANGN